MHSYLTAHCALARDRSRNVRSPFTGRFPFLASPLRSRLANASGRIEFIIVFFMDWSFASGCSPPRLSTTQLPSATDRPVFLSDEDFHLIVGAYSQAHSSTAFRALAPTASFRGSLCFTSLSAKKYVTTYFSVLERTSKYSSRSCSFVAEPSRCRSPKSSRAMVSMR